MRKQLKALLGIGLGMAIAIAGAGESYSAYGPEATSEIHRLSEYGAASAPLGFVLFCLEHPQHCQGGGASEIRLTSRIMATLHNVNTSVNRRIRPRNEKRDVWSINVTSGDCEDYALTKRARLIAAGLPASALRLATVRTSRGEGHAVLVVRTNAGDLVLDNLSGQVKDWKKTGLKWVAMSSASPIIWRKL